MYPEFNFGAIGQSIGQMINAFTNTNNGGSYYPQGYYGTPYGYGYPSPNPYVMPNMLDYYNQNTGFLSGSSGILVLGLILVAVVMLVK